MKRKIVHYELLSCGEPCPYYKELVHGSICIGLNGTNDDTVLQDHSVRIPRGWFPIWCPLDDTTEVI
jgi:hypothetical protein